MCPGKLVEKQFYTLILRGTKEQPMVYYQGQAETCRDKLAVPHGVGTMWIREALQAKQDTANGGKCWLWASGDGVWDHGVDTAKVTWRTGKSQDKMTVEQFNWRYRLNTCCYMIDDSAYRNTAHSCSGIWVHTQAARDKQARHRIYAGQATRSLTRHFLPLCSPLR